jgi:cytosine/adenosine deaminase-related metal-dependent hydrolase
VRRETPLNSDACPGPAASLLITNVTAVTMDARRRIVADAAIAVEGDTIVAVDKRERLAADGRTYAAVLDAQGMVALPGLIDTHAHADQSLLRGLGDQCHWMPFLDDIIDPWLAQRDPADAVLANRLAMVEMLRAGTTCFVSPNVDPRDDMAALVHCVGEVGIRAVLGRFCVAGGDTRAESTMLVDDAARAMATWHGSAGGLVSMWFGLDVPRRPGDRDHPHYYRAVADAARAMHTGITYHFCSEFEDAVFIRNRYGQQPAEWSRDNHALGANVLLINGCQLTPLELRILADSGSHLAHSPVANMKMATGILPLPDVLAAGVNVSLGTDGALNNNGYDLFGEMKAACLLQNATRRSASALTAHAALELATVNGAKAVGRPDLGSLEAGKRADIVLLDLRAPALVPVHDLVSNLVFCGGGSRVHTVFVGGRKVLDAGRVVGVDEAALAREAQRRAEAIRRQLQLHVRQPWPVE